MLDERLAEVETQRVPEPVQVLDRQRVAQTELLADLRDELRL